MNDYHRDPETGCGLMVLGGAAILLLVFVIVASKFAGVW